MYKIIFGILTLTVVSVFALQVDDELHPRAFQWIEEVRSKDSSEAYLYLMGLFAKEAENPIEAGSKIYQSIKDGQRRYILKQSKFYYNEYPSDNKLKLPEGDLFCKVWKDGCLKTLFQNPSRNEQEIERHSVLLNRYREFLDKNDYKTLSIPMVTEPIPPFKYLTSGHRLHNLNAIAKASRGEVDSAVETIYLNVSRIRANLVNQDQLIGKMIFLMMLSESLDVMTVLFDKYQPKNMKEIGALSVEERDLEYPMARELGMAYDMYRDLDQNPEFWKEGGNALGWVIRIFFKPNMTVNAIYPIYKSIAKTSRLSQEEFANYVENESSNIYPIKSLRNYIGSVLNEIATPAFTDYVGRFFDVNCKIELFNRFISADNSRKLFTNSGNPYGAVYDLIIEENGNKVCFDGPLPDQNNYRCIKIRI